MPISLALVNFFPKLITNKKASKSEQNSFQAQVIEQNKISNLNLEPDKTIVVTCDNSFYDYLINI